ncbi:MAG: hypothetical protein ACI85F_002554 [Bacteroidia bacterium]|jgi:hypothetical protein
MKKHLLTLTALAILSTGAFGQDRYLTEIFTDVTMTSNVEYGQNWYVFSSNVEDAVVITDEIPEIQPIRMDVYEPVGDTVSNRIPVIIMHTGNFLPRYFNQATTGSRTDKSVTSMANSLAKRGYVAFPISYRLGWNPLSTDEEVRKGTILNAIYRALLDVKTCVRYLRKTVAEDGNPHGIDAEKTVLFGFGTGGYISTNYVALDRMAELEIEKFTNSAGNIYIDTSLVGQIDGSGGAINVYNHSSYSNDVLAAVNAGGALGDSSWSEAGEPPVISFHCPDDPFAPFEHGIVVVPGTNFNVVDVSGSKRIIGEANANGNNQIMRNQTYTDPVSLASYDRLASSHPALGLNPDDYEGLYPFIRPTVTAPESAPWDWWNPAEITGTVDFLNTIPGVSLDASAILAGSSATNPDMSEAKSDAYIDTIVQYMSPRLVHVLVSGVDELDQQIAQNTFIYPNPAAAGITIRVNGFKMTSVEVFNLNGALVAEEQNLNTGRLEMNVENLPAGLYLVKVRTDEGFTTQKLSVR